MNTLTELKRALLKPTLDEDGTMNADTFDPWEDVLGGVMYGCYSYAFDKMAITVLTGLRDWDDRHKSGKTDDLAYQMFQEILCVKGYANYGGSPRGCFWEFHGDEDILALLVHKWREYAAATWKDDEIKESLSAHQRMKIESALQKCRAVKKAEQIYGRVSV